MTNTGDPDEETMSDVLMITLGDQWYRTDTGTQRVFDSSMFGDLAAADVGHPLTVDGEDIQDVRYERMQSELLSDPVSVENTVPFHERYCVTDESMMTGKAKLRDGSTVDVAAYDVVLVSHFWMYHHYLEYLMDEYPNVQFIGVLEESVQDIAYSSAELQMAHYRTIERLDGYVASTPQMYEWICEAVDNALYLPLAIPRGQFEGEPTADGVSNTVCVGVGTFALQHSNFYSNLLVLDRLRSNGHDQLGGEIIGIRDEQAPAVDPYTDQFEFLSTRGFITEGLYDHLADLKFAVLLTTRATVGRMSAELAGLGVPVIGNINNDMQRRCFPELSVDPYDLSSAVTLAERLMSDESFYRRTVERGRRAVADLQNHEHYERAIRTYIDEIADA